MSRRAIPLLWLAAMALCAWLALFKTPLIADITLFLPRTGGAADLLLEQLNRGPATRLILLGLEGGSEQARAMISQRLAARLRTTGLFTRVANGAELVDKEEQRKLFSYRYLLSPAVDAARFTPAGLRAALQQRLRDLSSPWSSFEKQLLPADPTGELLTLARLWQGEQQAPAQRYGVWTSPDGQRALLLAETQAAGYDLDSQQRVVAAITAAFAAVNPTDEVKLLLSGPGILAVLSQATIRHEAELLSAVAMLLLLLIVWAAFRSLRPVLLSALTLASAILVAVAVGGLLFGGVFGITLAFGMTLLGETVDYPLMVFAHTHGRDSVASSLRAIWPTLRLCAATTILGCFAMLTASFPGLAQLGVVTIAGLLTAAAFTGWVLPMLFPPGWAPRRSVEPRLWLAWLLQPRPRLAAALALGNAALLLLVVAAAPPLWEDDLAALSPIPAPLLQLDQELRGALGAPEVSHMIVVAAADSEAALAQSETVAAYLRGWVDAGRLGGFDLAARYLPSLQTQRARQAALPDPATLQASLDAALAGLPFQPNLFQPFLAAVETARAGPLLQLADLRGTTPGLRAGSLLFPGSRGWTALILLQGARDPAGLAAGLRQQGYAGVHYLDMRAEASRLTASFRSEALVRLAWGMGLIVLVVWLSLKSARLTLAALAPVALAINLDVAILLGLGERLSLFHLVSLLLVLGIGADYGLFFSRAEPDPSMRQRTLYGLLACSSSTISVFGMLALSSLPVLKAIGQTVAIGAAGSLLLALILTQPLAASLGAPRNPDHRLSMEP